MDLNATTRHLTSLGLARASAFLVILAACQPASQDEVSESEGQRKRVPVFSEERLWKAMGGLLLPHADGSGDVGTTWYLGKHRGLHLVATAAHTFFEDEIRISTPTPCGRNSRFNAQVGWAQVPESASSEMGVWIPEPQDYRGRADCNEILFAQLQSTPGSSGLRDFAVLSLSELPADLEVYPLLPSRGAIWTYSPRGASIGGIEYIQNAEGFSLGYSALSGCGYLAADDEENEPTSFLPNEPRIVLLPCVQSGLRKGMSGGPVLLAVPDSSYRRNYVQLAGIFSRVDVSSESPPNSGFFSRGAAHTFHQTEIFNYLGSCDTNYLHRCVQENSIDDHLDGTDHLPTLRSSCVRQHCQETDFSSAPKYEYACSVELLRSCLETLPEPGSPLLRSELEQCLQTYCAG